MVHEAFSLIYLLPDKVLRWMGVSGEGGTEAGSLAKQQEGSVDKGIGLGKSAMQTALTEADNSRKGAGGKK
jgi:hypothetical protein